MVTSPEAASNTLSSIPLPRSPDRQIASPGLFNSFDYRLHPDHFQLIIGHRHSVSKVGAMMYPAAGVEAQNIQRAARPDMYVIIGVRRDRITTIKLLQDLRKRYDSQLVFSNQNGRRFYACLADRRFNTNARPPIGSSCVRTW